MSRTRESEAGTGVCARTAAPGSWRGGLLVALSMALAGLAAPGPGSAQAPGLIGFQPERAATEIACEAAFQGIPNAASFRRHLEQLTGEPHQTGSDANVRVADFIAQVMGQAGLEVERFSYDVYLPGLETDVRVDLVTPQRQPLNNQEDILPQDVFTAHPDLAPAWNAYSGSGDVTAEVIYANYARREDFDELERLGVDVAGKIVLARYGGNFRGYKAKYAEAAGAVGLLIYSDPADGGYLEGLPYPEGPQLTRTTIQRGSVLTLPYAGDPLTPFEPALPEPAPGVTRLDPASVGLPGIPVAPLPYGSAQQILERMDGIAVPDGWQGGLPFAYRVEGGRALTVRLRVEQPLGLARATNVIGTLRGGELPEEWVILGSHYDAWGFGAADPNGGTAMLLTLAEGLAGIAREGCVPRRTIKIAHWDAEEYGIIGSTEWVEQFAGELETKALVYLNADGAVTGPNFGVSSAPSLKEAIIEASKSVAYPGRRTSVHEEWLASSENGTSLAIDNLGGGSDHVAFYTHVGVPSAGLSFDGPTPIYHSNYDTFGWFERFADPTFEIGPALARIDGVVALRFANADVLPYDVSSYPTDVLIHLADIERRADEQALAFDAEPLRSAVTDLTRAAIDFRRTRDARLASGGAEALTAATVNGLLIGLEKAWLHQQGLQERPWSRSVYASPDPFSGYASWMLPGLRYEVETGGASLNAWTEVYVQAVNALTARLRQATSALEE